ncbi:EscV/YscV/HrcV family type III secretion system export apparatus protein [Burkholderia dolosa]|nr:EscV/YscV/HrcV family type III secretion system export apparatus protein [Burkholderia dolosa]
MLNTLADTMRARPEFVVLGVMVVVVAMLIVPLPPALLDVLIALNIVTALIVLIGSFYIVDILEFSSFPSVLLITTLFRLALTISTSRMILLSGDGGQIIATFGEYVIGENLVVGLVVFAIVTVVQFIVITKGSERVAEVAARFSLDAMPGKQMSIDSDLRAGIIDSDGVAVRRAALARESQLYGAFDGAMKFIKGDAIAGIIVIFVNLIGGMAIGILQRGMPASQALTTYTILSVGDGLVSQIPALLISISAGFMVTHVSGADRNLGAHIVGELLSKPLVLVVSSGLAIGIGLMPGFPLLVFLSIAAVLGGLAVYRRYGGARRDGRTGPPAAESGSASCRPESGGGIDVDAAIPETVPLMLRLSDGGRAASTIASFRQRAFLDMGLRLPEIHVVHSDQDAGTDVVVLINEIHAATLSVDFGAHRVIGSAVALEGLSIDTVHLPDGVGGNACWVPASCTGALAKLGVPTRPADDDLYRQFLDVVLRNIVEFFGVHEAKQLLDDVEKKYPDLIKECYRHIPVQRIAEVFQRLLAEQISIRNMKLILESLVQWGPREKDVVLLVEHVRSALARYITERFSTDGALKVLVLSAEFESAIHDGVRQTSGGAYLNLDPSTTEQLVDRVALALTRAGCSQRDLVVLAPVEIRRFVKRLVESRFRDLGVLSFGEVTDSVRVDVLKTI